MLSCRQTSIYDQLSGRYDRAHDRWLRHAGGEAQCAFEGAATALLRPSMTVLDAACGTGTVARRLLRAIDGRITLTLLDASPKMLEHCADIEARRIRGLIQNIPLPGDTFDLVTCAWGIETLPDPTPALAEFLRVCRPGGFVCLVFCADRPARSITGEFLRHRIAGRGLGAFLCGASILRTARTLGARNIRPLHCTGPAAAVLFQK
ncbi:class I SAM-dependent methyltransferase [Thalassococcus sp. S3]|uniref:class I SAM-dependent methyltransferase n=1 Tax=Thalassococcus sp. S3 TaxID=2017482 RepID=UPI001024447F|nr:methyltransferase domain-containing protein [Thalassococcus sp. S3]QBF33890.1 ubiquinone biosynthesis protein UbiE [Thalassococcus sp. S3]